MNNLIDPLENVAGMFADFISCIPPFLLSFFLICLVLWVFRMIYQNFKD